MRCENSSVALSHGLIEAQIAAVPPRSPTVIPVVLSHGIIEADRKQSRPSSTSTVIRGVEPRLH